MTTTTSTAITIDLYKNNLGIFESGIKQLITPNDRDIYKLDITGVINPPKSVVVLTEVNSAFTASGFTLNIEATNRVFVNNNSGILGSVDLLAASSGDPAYTFSPTGGNNIFVGISTASSPAYNPSVFGIDPGANVIFNYSSSIALVKTDLDTNGDGTIAGDELDALVLGINAADVIIGSEAADVIVGFSGNDKIKGGLGGDEIDGGSGSDRISGQLGDDTLRGGDGNDAIFGGLGNDKIDGNDGNDTLRGGFGNDLIFGDDGDDLISGEGGFDILFGGEGKDEINGGLNDDTLYGEDDDDLLRGLEDSDTLYGGDGNDDLRGNNGTDTLDGGLGNDVLRGQNGDDILFGMDGSDTLFGGQGNDTLDGGLGRDLLRGGSGKDILFGDDGDDFLSGEMGDDSLVGGTGNDTLIGGLGSDEFRGYSVDRSDPIDAAERDILVGSNDSARDSFYLAESGQTFYDQGGYTDFALLRNVDVDRAGVTSAAEDRIFLANGEGTYFLADIALPTPDLDTLLGVGIFLENASARQSIDLIAIVDNVFEDDIHDGLANDLFVI